MIAWRRVLVAALLVGGIGAAHAQSRNAPAPQAERRYIVQPGDTFRAIADRLSVAMEDLGAINGVPPPYIVRVGQSLKLDLQEFYAYEEAAYRSAFAAMRAFGAEAVAIASAPEYVRDASFLAQHALDANLPAVSWLTAPIASLSADARPISSQRS